MKKALVVFAAIFALGACGDPAGSGSGGSNVDKSVYPTTVQLNDGRTVECVVYDGYKAGGIWCVLQDANGLAE